MGKQRKNRRTQNAPSSPPTPPKPAEPSAEPKAVPAWNPDDYTSAALYNEDGENLSTLSDLLKAEGTKMPDGKPIKKIADVYRLYCAPIIEGLLREKMAAKLKKLSRKD